MKHLIPIKQIQRSDENTILWNWPLPDNSALLQRVKEITTGPRSDVKFRDQRERKSMRRSTRSKKQPQSKLRNCGISMPTLLANTIE